MNNKKILVSLFGLIGMIAVILSGCAEKEAQSTKSNGDTNEVSTENVTDTNEGESEEMDQAQEQEQPKEEPKPTLLHINTFEHMGDQPIPVKYDHIRTELIQFENGDVALFEKGYVEKAAFKGSKAIYTVLKDKQSYSEPKILPEGNVLVMNESGTLEEKPSNYGKYGFGSDYQAKVLQTSDGPGRGAMLVYESKGELEWKIVKGSGSSNEEIKIPTNGYGLYEDINDGYSPRYIDFVNNRVITFMEETASGMTDAYIQIFDLTTGEPMWDAEGQRLTVDVGSAYDPEFHVDENGIITIAWFDYGEKNILQVTQLDKDFNQIFHAVTPVDVKGEERAEIVFSQDGTINIYDFPLYKEKVHLNLTQMKVGIPEE